MMVLDINLEQEKTSSFLQCPFTHSDCVSMVTQSPILYLPFSCPKIEIMFSVMFLSIYTFPLHH